MTAASGSIQSLRRGFSRYYPFTAAGSLLVAVGIVFVARGTLVNDVYRMTLGVLAIFVPVILAIGGRMQSGRFADVETSWESRDVEATMTEPRRWGFLSVGVQAIRPWFFYRLHARVSGPVTVGERTRIHFYDDVAVAEASSLRVPIAVPLPGVGELIARLQIRDVFGLSRATVGEATHLNLVIPPGMPRAPQMTQTVATSGEEESTRTRSPEEERYYMREYIPGDRFRDINWKASSRIRELFTRISPETQEQSRTITVYLRHFGEGSLTNLEAIAHGAYIRGWLIAFMRTLHRQEPGVSFRVVTARGITQCPDEDAVDRFAWSLADLWLEREPPSLEIDRGATHAVVFTTPFDSGLAAFASRIPRASIHLFSTQFVDSLAGAEVQTADTVTILCGGTVLPIPPLRLGFGGVRTVQRAPGGAILVEEVALRPVWDRASYERTRSQGVEP